MNQAIMTPFLALIAWTLIMWAWMYATRIPAMQKAKINPAKLKSKGELDVLPQNVKNIADNYNHLHEQPVIFYALVLYAVTVGNAGNWMTWLAWAYVGLRVVHSLIQCTSNFIPLRFAIFMLSALVLVAMTVMNVMDLFAAPA